MKFAPILGSNLTGRIGGIVASHNSSGTYFRRYVIPVNPNTSGQQAQRNAFATVSQRWRSLSGFEQQAWVSAGPQNTVPNSTGGSLQLTGQQLFMRMNTLRQRLGLALVTTAPTSSVVPSITIPTATVNLDGTIDITFDSGDEWNQVGGGILCSVSPLLAAGRNFNNQFLAVFGSSGFPGPVAPPAQIATPYNTQSGGRITIRCSAVTPDGRLSDYLYFDVTTPLQSVLQSIFVQSAVSAHATFNNPVVAADFAAADFQGAWRTTCTAVAQGADQFTNASPFLVVPSGAAAAYSPQVTGVTL
jgi:hypothetical protein